MIGSSFSADIVAILTFIVCFRFISLTDEADVTRAGFRGRVTKRGLDFGSNLAVEFLMRYLPVAEIPDVEDNVGSMKVKISNITIKSFHRPTLRVDLISSSPDTTFGGIRVELNGLNPTIDCNMKMTYNFGLFKSTRELSVTIVTTRLQFSLESLAGLNEAGDVVLPNLNCNMNGEIQMIFSGESGGLSGMFGFITETLNDKIKEIMFHQVCSNLTSFINESAVTSMTARNMSQVQLDDDLYLDLRLTKSTKFTQTFFENDHQMTFGLYNGKHLNSSIAPIIPPHPSLDSRMTYIFTTNHLFNTLWFALSRTDKLRYTINSTTPGLPRPVKRYLATTCPNDGATCLGTVYPQLTTLYPNKTAEIDLTISNQSFVPFVRIRGPKIEGRIEGTADFFVLRNRKSRDFVFSAFVTIAVTLDIFTNDNKLHYNLTRFNLRGNITESRLEKSSQTDSLFQTFLSRFYRRFLHPFVRDFGATGYEVSSLPLPSPVHLENVEFIETQTEGLLIIGLDVGINGPIEILLPAA